jgi:hypothetical protein
MPEPVRHFIQLHLGAVMAVGGALWLITFGFLLALPILAVRSLRARDPRLHERYFRVAAIVLGLTMVLYAVAKPYLQLAERPAPPFKLGETSDVELFWYFFSLKRLYVWFTCGTELIAGLGILWWRTRRFGLLMMCAIMVNVTALDFAYLHSQPVKWWALLLVVAAASCVARELPLYLDLARRLLVDPPAASAAAPADPE